MISKARTLHFHLILVVLSSVLIFIVAEDGRDTVLCSTKNGELLGSTEISRGGRKYSAFRGIPYAEKPERFTEAKLSGGWDRVRNATAFGESCPQLFGSPTPLGDEDCLFLNVYSPSLKPNKKQAVLVWIHGGGFQFGTSSDFAPNYWMDHDVVLVSINYRLGLLGFLSTGDEQVLGNWGLKDQVLALKWVSQNIHSFGGDKDQVTIFGESAGGASVDFHVISKKSKGLFKNAIAISGSALSGWALQRDPKPIFAQLPAKTDCPSSPLQKTLNCLKELDVDKLLTVQNSYMEWFLYPVSSFGPVIEPPTAKSSAMITESPLQSMESGRVNKVSFMNGMAKNEGLFFTVPLISNPAMKQELNSDFGRLIPIALMYKGLPQDTPGFTGSLLKSYMGSETPEFSQDTLPGLESMFGDAYIKAGVVQSASLLSSHIPTHSYLFNYVGEASAMKPYWGVDAVMGSTHSDIHQYLWKGWMGLPVLSKGGAAPSEIMSLKLIQAFVHFAETGKPKGWGKHKKWEPLNKGGGSNLWYVIDGETGVEDMSKEEMASSRLKLWDQLVFKEEGGGGRGTSGDKTRMEL